MEVNIKIKIKYWKKAINKIGVEYFGEIEILEVIVNGEEEWILGRERGGKEVGAIKDAGAKLKGKKED